MTSAETVRAGTLWVLGGANLDTIASATATLHRGDSTPGQVRSSPGGVARNVAENLARLGHAVHLVSAVGDDPAGRALLAATLQAGVNVSACQVLADEATASYVATHDHDGTLLAAINDMQMLERLTPDVLAPHAAAVRAAAVLVVDCNLSDAALAWVFAQHGAQHRARLDVPVFADAVSAPKCTRLRPWLERLHTLKLNRLEAQALSGLPTSTPAEVEAAADWLNARGVARVVVSVGAQGLYFSATGQRGWQAAVPPPAALCNTNGAGDALLAGLVHAHVVGLPLAEAARVAAACAALTTTRPSANHPGLSPALVAQCLASQTLR